MSTLVVCGLNHNGSSIEKRERVAMPKHCLVPAMRYLSAHPGITEATILSTCNRTEVYIVAEGVDLAIRALEQFFRKAAGTHDEIVQPNLTEFDDAAIMHLFKVASGFDSVVVGEGQILAQVGEALTVSQEAGTAGPLLNKLFNLALHCGKRVRHETGISRKAVSVASAAIELASDYGAIDPQQRILIIGAGRMGTLCTKHLLSKSKSDVTIFNPSQGRLDDLCETLVKYRERIHVTASSGSLPALVQKADTIFVATSADHYMVMKQDLTSLAKTPFIFDLSMPRNVDPLVAQLPGVRLFSIDDLQKVVQQNLAQRQLLIDKAHPILLSVSAQYNHWLTVRAHWRALRGGCRDDFRIHSQIPA